MIESITFAIFGGMALLGSIIIITSLAMNSGKKRREARLLCLGLIAMLPTYLGIVVRAITRLFPLPKKVFWWPLADWAALLMIATLVDLALVFRRKECGQQCSQQYKNARLLLYGPLILLVPMVSEQLWTNHTGESLVPIPVVYRHGLLLLTASVYAVIAAIMWRRLPRTAVTSRWYRGIIIAFLMWSVIDHIWPGIISDYTSLQETLSLLPHMVLLLLFARAAVDHGLIFQTAISNLYRLLNKLLIIVFALAGGTALGALTPEPWSLPVSAATTLLLTWTVQKVIYQWLALAPPEPVPPPAIPQGLDLQQLKEGLTPRQIDVISGVLEGLSNAEIAERLHITVATVKKHLTKVYAVFNVASRTELIANLMAIQQQATSQDPSFTKTNGNNDYFAPAKPCQGSIFTEKFY